MGYCQRGWKKINVTPLSILKGKSQGKPGCPGANLTATARDIILEKLINIANGKTDAGAH